MAFIPTTFRAIMADLRTLVAAHTMRTTPARAAFLAVVWSFVGRATLRFERLYARFQAGTLPAPRSPRPPRPGRPRTPSATPRLPARRAWLLRDVQPAANFGTQLQHILTHPDFPAFLAAAPQAGRILRPLCRMLGADPPEILRLPPPPLKPPPAKPPARTPPEPDPPPAAPPAGLCPRRRPRLENETRLTQPIPACHCHSSIATISAKVQTPSIGFSSGAQGGSLIRVMVSGTSAAAPKPCDPAASPSDTPTPQPPTLVKHATHRVAADRVGETPNESRRFPGLALRAAPDSPNHDTP